MGNVEKAIYKRQFFAAIDCNGNHCGKVPQGAAKRQFAFFATATTFLPSSFHILTGET